MAQVSKDSKFEISQEFIESGKSLQSNSKKRGGRYTKDEKLKRQNEVYRLHFEYGYSARQIAEIMKINRNTINDDVSLLYSKLQKESDKLNYDNLFDKQLARLESQRVRLRKELDNDITLQERLQIEKMIIDLDLKISSYIIKIRTSGQKILDGAVGIINRWMESSGHSERYVSHDKLFTIPEKSREKIFELLKDK